MDQGGDDQPQQANEWGGRTYPDELTRCLVSISMCALGEQVKAQRKTASGQDTDNAKRHNSHNDCESSHAGILEVGRTRCRVLLIKPRSWPDGRNLYEVVPDLSLRRACRRGNIGELQQELFVGGNAIFDCSFLGFSERDLLEQAQQVRLASSICAAEDCLGM